jgi:hypothetical protein
VLIVRQEQVAVFETALQQQFAERMVPYIERMYPGHYGLLGELGTFALVKKGITLAERHGIDDRHDQAKLILLMVEFGERFERSPERPWAEQMLLDKEIPGAVRVSAIRARLDASTDGRRLAPPQLPPHPAEEA